MRNTSEIKMRTLKLSANKLDFHSQLDGADDEEQCRRKSYYCVINLLRLCRFHLQLQLTSADQMLMLKDKESGLTRLYLRTFTAVFPISCIV